MKFGQTLLFFCIIAIPAFADVVSVSPDKLDFGSQLLMTSTTQLVILANASKKPLNIAAVSASGDFSVSANSCGATLSAGNQCAIWVTFVPTAAGPRTGLLQIDDDSTDTPHKVKLSGAVPVTSITVTPANVTIAIGLTKQFTAVATYSNGANQDVTGLLTWTSSATGIATIAAGGLASGIRQGTANIMATSGGVSGQAVLAVVVLQSIAITPSNPSIAAGRAQQFAATGSFSDGTTQDVTKSVQWSVQVPTVATISAAGLATGISQGITSVFASSGAIQGSTGLTVTPPQLLSVTVTPANASVGIGVSQQYKAIGDFTNGPADITKTAQWFSSAPGIASVSASGLATGVSFGNTTISAGGCNPGVACAIIEETTNLEVGGIFSDGPFMSAARSFHTATTLNNGKILLAGGSATLFDPSPLASAEIFDPKGSASTGGILMSSPRMRHTATLLSDGNVLFAGGLGGLGVPTAEIFNPATLTFTSTGSMMAGRVDHTATFLLTGQVLMAGGFTATAELYNPATGVFTPTGSMTSARRGHAAVLFLLTGGFDANGLSLASAEIYNPATGLFTPIPNMLSARAYHRATLLNGGKVLLSGGTTNRTGWPSAAELYDPGVGVFVTTGPINVPRDSHTATLLLNGQVLISGGENSFVPGGIVGTTEKYDPISGTFSLTATGDNQHFDPKRVGHTATPLGKRTGPRRRRLPVQHNRDRLLPAQRVFAPRTSLDFHYSGQSRYCSWVDSKVCGNRLVPGWKCTNADLRPLEFLQRICADYQ
jgi:hypothetical protein